MNERSPSRLSHALSARARDVAVVAAGAMGVFAILAMSGALGWVEAFTACIVMLAGAMAYYVGSTQPEPAEAEQAGETRDPPADVFGPAIAEVLAALPLPALHVGEEGRIDAANVHASRLLRIREEQRSLAASVIRYPALLEALDRALAERLPAAVDVPRGGGEDGVWLAHVVPCGRPGTGVLILMEDRTALRRAERARADFLANASHELRTPLTSLAGFIETMRGPARDDRDSWDRFLDIMYEQTERMKRLIADLLSLSSIESSEHKPPEKEDDVAGILLSSVQSLRPVAAERGITLEFDGPEMGLTAVVVSDEITQVAQNLLVNAVKYSADGGRVHVTCGLAASMDEAQVRAGRQWDEAARMTIVHPPYNGTFPAVWIRVADEGPGIERVHLPRLGQRFYRVDESRGGDVTGTGLGLAIVKHIMARHRGGLIVESLPGRGSAFGVWCQAAETAQPGVMVELPPRSAPLQRPADQLADGIER